VVALVARFPCRVTVLPDWPMVTPVAEVVPMVTAPLPSTATSALPDRPEPLTVSVAWAVRVKDRGRTMIPSNNPTFCVTRVVRHLRRIGSIGLGNV